MEYTARLYDRYKSEIIPKMMKTFNYSSVMEVPRLVKVNINQGVGAATQDKKLVQTAQEELTLISGQKAVQTYSKKAISNFKLREDMPIGTKVTLRRDRMYEFVDRLVSVALPRVRDFRGISNKGFDGRGNYTLGITEQIIFPEINIDKVSNINGMNVTFVTTAKTDKEAHELLSLLGLPFQK